MTEDRLASTGFVLGLDIGVASIGWAVIEIDHAGQPAGVRRAGVHLFDAGIDPGKNDPETALQLGREQSKATPRRAARAMRRQTWRRARRKRALLRELMSAGLLTPGDVRTPEQVDTYLKALDRRLAERYPPTSHAAAQNLPYRLRAVAAVEPVDDREAVGRAIYHLAQRRGFLSNRRTPERGDEERSKVKQGIAELASAIERHEPPTLGAYLGSLDPDETRLRGRWTSRQMFVDEFERIWQRQAPGLGLSEVAKAAIHRAIFFQRPLKDQSHLVGRCSLVPLQKRCPIGERVAQRFRVLQQVNHLRVVLDDVTERPLRREERTTLLDALLTEGDLTIARARRLVGLPRGCTFSIERGGEKRLVGHRTDAKLRDIFGAARWDALAEADRDAIVEAVRSIREPETLARYGRARWELDRDSAERFGDVVLEEGHSAHCRAALHRLVSRMEADGLSYSEARKDEYPESFESGEARNELPSLKDWNVDLRNPSVARALTELRKVVNAIVRRWGKPLRMHVELARDLKSGRGKREAMAKRMRDREAERTKAASDISAELGIRDPRGWMIEKWLLAEECGWQCPYTGRVFGAQDLLGAHASFDVEHIWPLSQSLDNSFLNKTICYHEENRLRKKGRSPLAAYSAEELDVITQRVRAFKGDPFSKREKLRRFTEELDDGFTARHLQETRYIGRLACDYLGLLYGGRAEETGAETRTQRIVTPSGGLTAWLRRGWGLDRVLSETDAKSREDHRHHAIDAIVIACADQRSIQRLAEAAERMERQNRDRPFDTVDEPWAGFVDDVGRAIEPIVVSKRISRKVRGGLHLDTIYSKPHTNGKGTHHRTRTELASLTAADLEKDRIVDKRALAAIRAKLAELGEANPQKAFKNPANLPTVRGHDGRDVRLRRVRVIESVRPVTIGRGATERRVRGGANYHTVVYRIRDRRGAEKWGHEVVSLLDAAAMVKPGGPARPDRAPVTIRPKLPDGAEVLFTLANGECLEMDDPKQPGVRAVYRVIAISHGDIQVVRTWDNRRSAISGTDRTRIQGGGDNLRRLGARKVRVTTLGEVVDAG